jgi:hypothetical protein
MPANVCSSKAYSALEVAAVDRTQSQSFAPGVGNSLFSFLSDS